MGAADPVAGSLALRSAHLAAHPAPHPKPQHSKRTHWVHPALKPWGQRLALHPRTRARRSWVVAAVAAQGWRRWRVSRAAAVQTLELTALARWRCGRVRAGGVWRVQLRGLRHQRAEAAHRRVALSDVRAAGRGSGAEQRLQPPQQQAPGSDPMPTAASHRNQTRNNHRPTQNHPRPTVLGSRQILIGLEAQGTRACSPTSPA